MTFLVKAILLAVIAGCAPAAMKTGPEHPASPDAPTGRLAGPPAALRPGVVDISIPEPKKQQVPKPKQPPAQGHEGHH